MLHAGKALNGRSPALWFALIVLLVVAGNGALLHWSRNPLLIGQATPDWPYFFDFLVTLPLLYAAMFRPGWRRLLQVLLVCFAASYLLGHWLIPAQYQVLWQQIDWLRYAVLAGIVMVELMLIWRVLKFLLTALRTREFADDAIEPQLSTWLGRGAASALLAIEFRVWYYALLHRARNRIVLEGDQHFSTHDKDANQADQLAFIFLTVLELPVLHLVLHSYGWGTLAWVLSGFTVYGLLFLIAEYRATALRPISLTADELIIRRGIWGLRRLPLASIASVTTHRGSMARSLHTEIYDANREPNIVLTLQPSTVAKGRLGGEKVLHQIALGLDEPESFRLALLARLEPDALSKE